jgi:hypothetical protein
MSIEETPQGGKTTENETRQIIQQAIEDYVRTQNKQSEPAYKTELLEERKRRELLETRLNSLVEENKQARAAAEEADRYSQIRQSLQKLGVQKVELAFRAVKDDLVRGEDGRLTTKGGDSRGMDDFLAGFVQENPELLPPRISGGAGTPSRSQESQSLGIGGIEIDRIKAGMKPEDLERVRQEISRLASKTLKGQ